MAEYRYFTVGNTILFDLIRDGRLRFPEVSVSWTRVHKSVDRGRRTTERFLTKMREAKITGTPYTVHIPSGYITRKLRRQLYTIRHDNPIPREEDISEVLRIYMDFCTAEAKIRGTVLSRMFAILDREGMATAIAILVESAGDCEPGSATHFKVRRRNQTSVDIGIVIPQWDNIGFDIDLKGAAKQLRVYGFFGMENAKSIAMEKRFFFTQFLEEITDSYLFHETDDDLYATVRQMTETEAYSG